MIVHVLLFGVLALQARAQIPSLGFCPDYLPMADFDLDRFSGPWYEAERYFQLTEVASRCVMSNYTKGMDGKYRVSNEVTSRFTGIKRILEGEIRIPSNKKDEGKIIVRYTSVPLITPETTYSVLKTDYDSYAVMWSCTGVGPVHTQNAWVMTRKRLATGEALQKAYAVLDKYKISKTFFVKTDQDDCAILEALPLSPVASPARKPIDESDTVEISVEEMTRDASGLRDPLITPDAPEIIKMQARNSHREMEKVQADQAKETPLPTIMAVPAEMMKVEDPPALEKAGPVMEEVKTVPEVIKKIAEQTAAMMPDMPMEKMAEEMTKASEPMAELPRV